MPLGYRWRAGSSLLRHPAEGAERIRGRLDRHRDRRELASLGIPVADHYRAVTEWAPALHASLGSPWPCAASTAFDRVWSTVVTELTGAGVRVGRHSYGGWNDGDRAMAHALWCILAHLGPRRVVETGVAHGLTSRILLEGLRRNGSGHLWSIDLPAVDSALHPEIGMAVPADLRAGWTYLSGTSRAQLPALLAELGSIDVFVHDSLHTRRNQSFELRAAWDHLGPGGVCVVDDVGHSLAFRAFVDPLPASQWLVTRHDNDGGLWGLAVKKASRPDRQAGSRPE